LIAIACALFFVFEYALPKRFAVMLANKALA
jgi:hypothetical protein